ncbi:MAG: M15 family metallopeptidase [Candidatus Paceibacterota bacterium]
MSLENQPKNIERKKIRIFILVLIILFIITAYLTYKAYQNKHEILTLNTEKSQLKTSLDLLTKEKELTDQENKDLSELLISTKEELEEVLDDLEREENRNEEFEDQIRKLTGTVKDLDKLSKTDEELLQKYSRAYFLNENYIPLRLEKINDRYVLKGKKDQYFHAEAIDFLEDMLDEARRDDIDLKIVSAYRSFDEQQEVKGQHTQVYGTGANAFSADQGYSEHQLGTTVDLTDEATGGTYQSFANTESYKWLTDNAYRFGFILSYPEGNEFYIYEPWHWRFVGVDLARDLHRQKDQFYEWEQRRIDEYLIKIFD